MAGRAATTNIIPGDYALAVGPADMPSPPGWKWVPLESVARLESGHTPSRNFPEYWDGGIPWIGIPDAREHHGGTIVQTRQTVSDLGLENSAARLLPKGTVCLSRTASVGYVVEMGRDMATSQDFVNFICEPKLRPEFLKLLFIAEKEALFRFGKGTTHTTIYYPEVKAFHVCLPPVNEQRRIVSKVQALQSRSRRAREALDSIPPLLEKLRQSILAAAFRGDLTKDWRAKHPDVEPASELLKRIRLERRKKWEEAELGSNLRRRGRDGPQEGTSSGVPQGVPALPPGWCWTTAKELAVDEVNAICAGPFGTIFKAKDFRAEGVPIIFLRHVAAGHYLTKNPGFMDRRKWEELFKPYSVHGGELLVTKLGEPPGVCAIYPPGLGPAMVTPDVIKMSADPRLVLAPVLMRFFNSELARRITFGVAYGTTRLRMTLDLFRDMPVPLPPMPEQVVMLERLDLALARLDQLIEQVQTSETRLGEFDRAVLSKAFRGAIFAPLVDGACLARDTSSQGEGPVRPEPPRSGSRSKPGRKRAS